MKTKQIWNKFGDVLGGTIFHPQFFVKRAEIAAVDLILDGVTGKVFLDIGCGRQQYRSQIEKLAKKYYALDSPKTGRRYQSLYPVDFWADATEMPLSGGGVELTSMIMVLEHLPDPEKAVAELYRVIKRGGRVVVCTVENYPGHDRPYNYTHWTKEGLTSIFERHGFLVKDLRSFGNYWEMMAIFRNVHLMHFVKKQPAVVALGFFALAWPLMIFGNVLASVVGRGRVGEEYSLAHLVVAEKAKVRK